MTPIQGDYGNVLILEVGINDLPQKQAEYFKKIKSDRSTIGFFYAHLSEYANEDVKKPYYVNAGTIIGKTSCTGNAHGMNNLEQGAHLHFGIRKDFERICRRLENRADPLPFIQDCTNR